MSKPRKIDLLVIGAGPAGLAAAIRAKEAGVKSIAVIERAEELGGILPQCIHHGFGLRYFKEVLTGPEYIHSFVKKVKDRIETSTHTMGLELSPDKTVTAVCAKGGLVEYKPRAVILATGCRERARGSISAVNGFLNGMRGSGILTAGTAQRMTNIDGFLPGNRILMVGSGDIGMIMARRYVLEGLEVVALLEILPFIGGLLRNEIQCLRDFDIPIHLNQTVLDIHGDTFGRVEAVTIVEVDRNMMPISGTEKRIDCDTIILSVGLIPENELSKMAGVRINPFTGGPVVDECWQTSVNGIFAAGNVVHIHDIADDVSIAAEAAAEYAVQHISGSLKPGEKIPIERGENIRYVVPNYFSKDRPLTLFMRTSWIFTDAVIKVGDIFEKKYPSIRPSEQITIRLSKNLFKKFSDKKLVVTCRGKETIKR
jgi:NADPH-dependent 2,4-dienoyl-CoA reductase/sulfur reductase-like enzyme